MVYAAVLEIVLICELRVRVSLSVLVQLKEPIGNSIELIINEKFDAYDRPKLLSDVIYREGQRLISSTLFDHTYKFLQWNYHLLISTI